MDALRQNIIDAAKAIENAVDAHDTMTKELKRTKSALESTSLRFEAMMQKNDQAYNGAIQTSIDLIKSQIEQRDKDIKRAEENKTHQLHAWKAYHRAVKADGMQELKLGEVGNCVSAIYYDGQKWLDESIARWEKENEAAAGEIRKLEWQMKA